MPPSLLRLIVFIVAGVALVQWPVPFLLVAFVLVIWLVARTYRDHPRTGPPASGAMDLRGHTLCRGPRARLQRRKTCPAAVWHSARIASLKRP
jgi:hypothetical protein